MKPEIDPSTFDDPALPDLVAAALGEIDESGDVDIAALCGERQDLVEAVRASVSGGQRLQTLQREQVTADRVSGRVLADRYQLNGRLGAGAMGVVYDAQDLDLGRPVAVKILRLGLIGSGDAELRFAREAEAMAAVAHRATITIYDRGRTEEDEAFLVMERLEGRTLRDLLDAADELDSKIDRTRTDWVAPLLGLESLEEPSFLRAAVRWTAELAAGLDAAHRSGVIHRDVKPSNAFIRSDGTAVLLDFGIAGLADGATITDEGAAVGTPAYMAPETLAREGDESPSLDIYGLAATLYHLLTGKAPYRGTPSQILARLATTDPVPAQRVRGDLPKDLRAILERGMARRVSDRYDNVAAFGADLEAFLEHRPVTARPIPMVTRLSRRLARSSIFWTATTALLLAGAWWTNSVLDARREASNLLVYRAAESSLPPNLVYGAPHNRVLSEVEGRDEVRRLLDEMVERRAAALPSVLTRAAFRLDHGDAAGAASDMKRIADEVGTPYARELAKRYAAANAALSGSAAVDTTDLPDATSTEDLYLQACHALRREDMRSFMGLIRDERLDGFPGVEPLRILIVTALDPVEGYERILAFEATQGGRTAQTAFQAGTCMLGDLKFPRGLEIMLEAKRLAPGSFRIRENLGIGFWATGRFDEAESELRQAIEFEPKNALPHLILSRVALDRGDVEASKARLETAVSVGVRSAVERGWSETLPAEILAAQAITAWSDSDPDGNAVTLAMEALTAFKTLPESALDPKRPSSRSARARMSIVTAIVKTPDSVFGAALDACRESRFDDIYLNFALRLLDAEEDPQLHRFLESLVEARGTAPLVDPFQGDAELDDRR